MNATVLRLFVFTALITGLVKVGSGSVGWSGEEMPVGLKRSNKVKEYIWIKTGTVMLFVPGGHCRVKHAPQVPVPIPDPHTWLRPDFQEVDVDVPPFYIGKYEFTVDEFSHAVGDYQTDAEKDGFSYVLDVTKNLAPVKRVGASWRNPGFPQKPNHPVVLVSWEDAAHIVGVVGLRLCIGDEWQKAAAWDDSKKNRREVPWGFMHDIAAPHGVPTPPAVNNGPVRGNGYDASLMKLLPVHPPLPMQIDDGYAFTAPVGTFPNGASYYGCMDMAGNVAEFVSDEVDANLVRSIFLREPGPGPLGHVVFGDNWATRLGLPVGYPALMPVGARATTVGFRVALSAP